MVTKTFKEDYRLMCDFASRKVKNTDVEDVVQEAFVSAVKNDHTFEGRSTKRTWLAGILKHKIYDYYKKKERESKSEFKEKYTPVTTADPCELKELIDVVQREMFELGGKSAKVLQYYCIDGLSARDVCKLMNISMVYFRTLLHRGRRILKERLIESGISSKGTGYW